MAQHLFLQNLLQGQAVEWRALGEVCELKRGQTITAKTKKDGNIPVISGGQQPAYYNAEFNREGETITVAGSGAYAGHLLFWNEPIYVSDAFSVKPDLNILNTKYVFHFLLNNQNWIYNLKKGSGVPHVYPKDLAKLQIPIPPLSVQSQIVQILDTFTELTEQLRDELTAELAMRQKQYQYYRNKLLTFDFEAVQSLATASDSGWHWYGRLWVRFLVNLGVGNQSIDLEMMKGYMEEAFHSFKLVILGVRQRKSKPITKHIAILVWLKVNYGKKIHYVSP